MVDKKIIMKKRKINHFLYELKTFFILFIDRFFPKTRPMIQYIKHENKDIRPLVGVEVGVFYGDNAIDILKNLNIKRLYLIDVWKDEDSYHDILKKFKSYDDKVVFIRKYSDVAVDDIKEQVDFVYIDCDHSYKGVKKDIEVYFPLVKTGGVIGGHDFVNYSLDYGSKLGVIRAVTEFCVVHGLKYEVKKIDWWIQK